VALAEHRSGARAHPAIWAWYLDFDSDLLWIEELFRMLVKLKQSLSFL
jgi:hypothetical protein